MMHFFTSNNRNPLFPSQTTTFPSKQITFSTKQIHHKNFHNKKNYDIIKCQHCKMKPSDHRKLNGKHDQTM